MPVMANTPSNQGPHDPIKIALIAWAHRMVCPSGPMPLEIMDVDPYDDCIQGTVITWAHVHRYHSKLSTNKLVKSD